MKARELIENCSLATATCESPEPAEQGIPEKIAEEYMNIVKSSPNVIRMGKEAMAKVIVNELVNNSFTQRKVIQAVKDAMFLDEPGKEGSVDIYDEHAAGVKIFKERLLNEI